MIWQNLFLDLYLAKFLFYKYFNHFVRTELRSCLFLVLSVELKCLNAFTHFNFIFYYVQYINMKSINPFTLIWIILYFTYTPDYRSKINTFMICRIFYIIINIYENRKR